MTPPVGIERVLAHDAHGDVLQDVVRFCGAQLPTVLSIAMGTARNGNVLLAEQRVPRLESLDAEGPRCRRRAVASYRQRDRTRQPPDRVPRIPCDAHLSDRLHRAPRRRPTMASQRATRIHTPRATRPGAATTLERETPGAPARVVVRSLRRKVRESISADPLVATIAKRSISVRPPSSAISSPPTSWKARSATVIFGTSRSSGRTNARSTP